jgi:hypothetical protein
MASPVAPQPSALPGPTPPGVECSVAFPAVRSGAVSVPSLAPTSPAPAPAVRIPQEAPVAADRGIPPTVPAVAPAEANPVLIRASVGAAPPPVIDSAQPVVHIGPEPSWQGGPAPEAAGGQFGHAPDYVWLVGELQYLQTRHAWRLRYGRPGDEDRYGGTVTLTGEALPSDCAGGQIVRVEGQLVNPNAAEPRPAFWVNRLQIIKAAPFTGE